MQAHIFKKYALAAALGAAAVGFAVPSVAADTVKIAEIMELTGPGTTSGTNFKDGVNLAVKEINAAGGILGRQIETTVVDTQSNPGIAKGLVQKAVDNDVFAVFGPVFTGSIMVSMAVTEDAKVPNFVGGEGAAITQQGNKYVFRTSLTQTDAMPKVARYLDGRKDVNTLAVLFVNNDFGKGGRDAILKALKSTHVKVVEDISTASGQVDFSSAVVKLKQSHADALFSYTNEEESARLLRELKKQGWDKPIIGETTIAGQKVIELAGPAANGAIAHVGLTVGAPVPGMEKFGKDFHAANGYAPDHNGIKGYTGVYMLKAAIEKVGKFDRQAVAAALHGMHISAKEHPGVLMDVTIDGKGDLDRESFLVQVVDGKQKVIGVLPPLSHK
ncbi:ABC transporter substrate-binding protein [Castellaniella sp. MT123]|uniref:ABC transporter substrate-binding protein n=1 Tax=Castellaniella sp. MT123 TaxID=3140381 RepID=UPI0031F3D752